MTSANPAVQPTGASHLVQGQIESQRRLAPVADRHVSFLMRVLTAIYLGYCAAVSANPRVINLSDLTKGVYIASEHLLVAVTSSNAQVRGTFTFNSGSTGKQIPLRRPVRLLLPIWFPEENMQDASVARFWNTFQKGGRHEITEQERRVLDDVLGLKIEIGQELVNIKQLAVLNTNSLGSTRNEEWGAFQFIREAGFCCVAFEITHSSEFVRAQNPVTISYHAPLFRKGGGGGFIYTPVFDPIPKGLSTMNTNRYSITVAAGPDCSLSWSSGGKRAMIDTGKSLTFAPKGWETFRVTVSSGANQRSALDARTALCFHVGHQWPGTSESER